MKYVLILGLLFQITIYAQENTYTLVKDGQHFEKPIYYLSFEDLTISNLKEKELVFTANKSRFIYPSKKNECKIISKTKCSSIKITKPEKLYSLETKEFNKSSSLVFKKTGFKPIPPINHSILKIFVLNKNECKLYEVEWL